MKKILLFIFLIAGVAAKAQYTPNSGAYSYKGLMPLKSLQLPTGCGYPSTNINSPDSNRSAMYFDSCNAKLYRFNPKPNTWSLIMDSANGGGVTVDSVFISNIDSIFINNQDSIFIISGNDTIYIGNSNQIRDTANLTFGYGLIVFDGNPYNPAGENKAVVLDTTILKDFISTVTNNDTTIISNKDSVAATFVDDIVCTPAGGEANGTKYLVCPSGATGVFTGHENDIAEKVGGVWTFTDPTDQQVVIVTPTSEGYQYTNSNWNRIFIWWRSDGNKGIGDSAFVGRKDSVNMYFRSFNKNFLYGDPAQNAYLPKYTGLQDSNLFFKPGLNGKIDTGHFHHFEPGTNVTFTNSSDTTFINATGGSGANTDNLDSVLIRQGSNPLINDYFIDGGFKVFDMSHLTSYGFTTASPFTIKSTSVYGDTLNVTMGAGDGNLIQNIVAFPDSISFVSRNHGVLDHQIVETLTPEYIKFYKYFNVPNDGSIPYNPKLVYPSDTLLTTPEFMYVSDNDTIKKYPFSGGGGGSSLFPTTGTGTATGNVTGELSGNDLQVQQGGNAFLEINGTSGNESSILSSTNSIGIGSFGLYTNVGNYAFGMTVTDGSNTTSIIADASANTITHTAGTHIFNGNVNLATTPSTYSTGGFDALVRNQTTGDLELGASTPPSLTSTYIGYGDGSNQLTGDANFVRQGDSVMIIQTSIANTLSTGLSIRNSTASTSVVPVQNSPSLRLRGNAWNLGGSGNDATAYWDIYTVPQSTFYDPSETNARGTLTFKANAFSTPAMTLSYNGNLSVQYLTATNSVQGDYGAFNSVVGASQLFGGLQYPSSAGVYRTTNAGSDLTPQLLISAVSNGVGNPGFMIDRTTGLGFYAQNDASPTTRRIMRANIYVTDLANTAGSEAGGLGFATQTGGAVAGERMRITPTGNVLVNTTTDVASSKLTVESTTQGWLKPRMTTTQRLAIASPAEGLEVYDLTLHKDYTWDGTTWQAHW